MKCPSCGMNIRDDTLVCGYCGEKIPQQQKQSDSAGRQAFPSFSGAQKGIPPQKALSEDGEAGEDEEEGGLSPYLQAGEQVLIGSLNVSVKKFFFHAYMTDRRIFLIDTQEKKLKVTAKDVPRNTLAGSTIEYSENSDPVLVLSIRSPDDEIKTMKIVFVQNGMDRSPEINEWIALLHKEDEPQKKPVEEPVFEDEAKPEHVEPVPKKGSEKPKIAPSARGQELRPARKPTKDLEKQPPVKRLISFTKTPEEEAPPEEQPEVPPRRAQVRQASESPRKVSVVSEPEPEMPPAPRERVPPVKKPEVQSAMKVAMKSAMKPLAQPAVRPPKRNISEHVIRRPVVEPQPRETEPAEPEYAEPSPRQQPASRQAAEPPRRPRIHEKAREQAPPEEPAEVPQFCHNCGKKLPLEANFCPGCGTRLGQNRTLPGNRFSTPSRDRRSVPADTVTPERRPPTHPKPEEPDEDEIEDERPQPTKPPVKKAPRGSEMTILHKFLRR